jgi:hypothetical protein
MTESVLAGWDNFYVIAGSAGAGLTGLTFVVIALGGDAPRSNPAGVGVFVTPTVVHFSSVLALAAYLAVPRQTPFSLSLGFGVGGLAGLAYVVLAVVKQMRRFREYQPVTEDWLGHVILPTLAYAGLLAAAFTMRSWPQPTLYGVAAVAMLLLFVGIHNAWDIAVWLSTRRPGEPANDTSKRDPG